MIESIGDINDQQIEELTTLEFKVIDTGIGMKQEDTKKLFQLFTKIKVKEGINNNGVGLGLTICKRLSEELGGGINLFSEEGKGSIFTFTIKTKLQEIYESHQTSLFFTEPNFEDQDDSEIKRELKFQSMQKWFNEKANDVLK